MTKLTNKKILTLIKYAQDFNLKRLKLENLEIEFFEKRVGIPLDLKTEEIPKDPMPTADQMLYWSTGYDPKAEQEEAEKEMEQALRN